jgi:chromosome segregation ATPase
MDPKAALSAIETALALISDPSHPPKIRYHEETGVLAAMGTAPELAAIRGVLDALEVSARANRQREQVAALTSAQQELEQKLFGQENRARRAEEELALVKEKWDRLGTQFADAQAQIQALVRDREQLAREREHLLEEINALRAEAADAQAKRPR